MWALFFLMKLYDNYDGITSLIGAPIVATGLTVICFPVVLIVGLFLRIPILRRFWNRSIWPATTITLVSAIGFSIGMAMEELLHPVFTISAFLGLFTSISHWPPLGKGVPSITANANKSADSRASRPESP